MVYENAKKKKKKAVISSFNVFLMAKDCFVYCECETIVSWEQWMMTSSCETDVHAKICVKSCAVEFLM